jgi:hypothetical protein
MHSVISCAQWEYDWFASDHDGSLMDSLVAGEATQCGLSSDLSHSNMGFQKLWKNLTRIQG